MGVCVTSPTHVINADAGGTLLWPKAIVKTRWDRVLPGEFQRFIAGQNRISERGDALEGQSFKVLASEGLAGAVSLLLVRDSRQDLGFLNYEHC